MQSSVSTNTFTFEHRVYFNETNAVGGVAYFSNYVKWQGMTREEYFIETVPSWREIMKVIALGQLNMITVQEQSHFVQHAFFGDTILIELQTADIKRFSFDMVFFMTNAETGTLLYEGIQKLAFDNFKGKFIEIPEPMLKSVQAHKVDDADERCCKLKRFFNIPNTT